MPSIKNNSTLLARYGKRLINTDPGSGEVQIFRQKPNRTFEVSPYMVVNASTPENERAFVLPVSPSVNWRFVYTGTASATEDDYE